MSDPASGKKGVSPGQLKSYGIITAAAVEFAVSVVLLTLLGRELDGAEGVVFTILGAVAGSIGGFMLFLKGVKKASSYMEEGSENE